MTGLVGILTDQLGRIYTQTEIETRLNLKIGLFDTAEPWKPPPVGPT